MAAELPRRRLRIALVSRELAPYTGGGIGTYVSVTARALALAGHEVHVITERHLGLPSASGEGVQMHGVEIEAGPAAMDAYPAFPMRHAMAVFTALRSLAAERPFDVIEFPEYWGEGYFALRARKHLGEFAQTLLAVRLHTPSRDVRELNRDVWWDREAACLDHMEGYCLSAADLVLSPTQALLERVRGRFPSLPPAVVHRHPWDEALTAISEGPPEPAAPPTVLYFGRLELRKGLALLVDAAVRLMDTGRLFEVSCIGKDTPTGPQGSSLRDHLQRRIPEGYRSRFHFEAHRPRPELAAAIRHATVCCFPSVWENFPNVALEAMSLGAAVVASDAGGMAEIIRHQESGWLFRGGDVTALVAALEHGLSAHEERVRIRERAPQRVAELCDPAALVRELEELVERHRPATVAPPTRVARSQPAVSVIIPCYNTGSYLEETVASVRAQTFSDVEILLVDDGSTDAKTLEVLDRLEQWGVRRITQANGGLSAARNTGLRAARGRWVLPLDSDDLIAPAFLERTVAALERAPDLCFATTLVSYFEDTTEIPSRGWIPWGLERDALGAINIASVSTALLVKEKVLAVGGYDEWMLFEDWDLYCRLARRGEAAAVIPEFLFRYRMRPDSIMHRMEPTRRHRLVSELLARYPDLPLDPSRTARLLLAEQSMVERAAAELAAHPPLRYRIADGVNEALKRVPGVQAAVKRVISGTSDR